MRDSRNAIGFLHAQLFGLPNNRSSTRERAGDSQDRQLIHQLRNFFSLNDSSFQWRARNFNRAARLELIDIFDGFTQLRAHANKHAEQRRARIVQAAIAHEQMSARLRSGRDKPKRSRGNVARNGEIARLGSLIPEDGDATVLFLNRPYEKIIQH